MEIDGSRPYCVYSHFYINGHVYVGAGKYTAAVTSKNMGPTFKLAIISTHKEYGEALLALGALTPPKTDGRRITSNAPIQCLETQMVFENQSAVARSCEISASAVSSHLAGKSPKSIRGLHFKCFYEYAGEFVDPVDHAGLVRDLRACGVIAEAPKRGGKSTLPMPGSLAALKTEDEKKAAREHAAKLGFRLNV